MSVTIFILRLTKIVVLYFNVGSPFNDSREFNSGEPCIQQGRMRDDSRAITEA